MRCKTLCILVTRNLYFGKQWKIWWNAAWFGISSGSTLFAKTKLIFRMVIQIFFGNFSLFIVSNQKEEYISAYGVKVTRRKSWADPEGGRGFGPPPPLKNHKNIGSTCNIGPDPLKIPWLPSGYHRHASETPSKWRFAGGPMMARL